MFYLYSKESNASIRSFTCQESEKNYARSILAQYVFCFLFTIKYFLYFLRADYNFLKEIVSTIFTVYNDEY